MNRKGEMVMSFLDFLKNKNLLSRMKFSLLVKKPHILKIYPRIFDKHGPKRMSPFPLSEAEGSLTLEASLVFPFFLFAIINILSIILSFGEYSQNLQRLHQQGKELALAAHMTEAGINVNNDMIMLTQVQRLEPAIPIIGFEPAKTIVLCRTRKWTGYDILQDRTQDEAEEWVYITPHGTRYHYNRDCSHLRVTIRCIGYNEIRGLRNEDGSKYTACEMCGENGSFTVVFYTPQGNRYHNSLQCSGLKRSVESVPISEVGSRSACSTCVGGE